jgi:diguanylate cyclase (GGDEF)-like protein
LSPFLRAGRGLQRKRRAGGTVMLERLGLPRPQIATKLYGTIALTLAVVYVLAGATMRFASQTEEAVGWIREESLQPVLASTQLEDALDRLRRMVASPPDARDEEAALWEERTYRELNRNVAGLIKGMGYGPAQEVSENAARLESQGAATLALARDQRVAEAAEAAKHYAAATEDLWRAILGDRRQKARAAEAALNRIAADSRSLITWVCAAAAACGLLIGPIGLLLLRRVLGRLQGIGTALLRLARNDTSVDIPGLSDQDEVGQLARSVAVFKAKSIELLQKKGEAERLNLQLDAAINNMPLGLSMFDAQGRLLVCNKTYAQMYNLPNELTRPGTLHCALWEHRTKQGARHTFSGMAAGRTPTSDPSATLTIEFGNERIISVGRQPLKGGGWVSLHEDITQRCRQEREITHLARHDALTNLANRALFRERLQQALNRLMRGQGFAVLCLDLDRFKSVNDTLGHPVGDALLKQVSERLVSCVRQGDLVARLGGDEFAIIQANVRDADQTETLAERIVETISKPYDIDGQRIDISTSIGMTLAPRDGSDTDQLMKNADLALYRAKSDGRRGYSFFKPEMNDRIQVRRLFEVDLRKALDKDELDLFFQPLISLQTQKVAGFEALLRWTHSVRGGVPAAEIVAVAEEIGLIADIGAWALRRACAQAARWPIPVKVAINLSPLQIRHNLIDVVLQALAASGLPPERLELEITETVFLQDSQNTLAVLHQLRQLGVRIAMDDFGTGYCSLSYLRSFPFDKIKIDRSFISDIERSDEAHAISQTIVGLGRSLGMETVAEGIENFEQLRLVRAIGCTEAQGFYFSPAVPAKDVGALLDDTFGQALNAA